MSAQQKAMQNVASLKRPAPVAPNVPVQTANSAESAQAQESPARAVGVDVGTMFFQTAELVDDKISVSAVRNAFVEIPYSSELEEILTRNGWRYVNDGTQYFEIGRAHV